MLFRAEKKQRAATEANASSSTLESLYREQFDFVYRKAARIGGPTIDPEDVVQEVFIVVQRRLHTFDHSSRITTWLYGITLNIARSMRTKTWRRRARDVEQVLPTSTTKPDRADVREAHRIAYEILDAMPAKKRDIFILAEFDELSCDEIAAIVGTKTETVWSRLHYARKEFSERLARREQQAKARAALEIVRLPLQNWTTR